MTTVARQLADLPYGHLLEPHDGPLRPGAEYDTVLFDSLDFQDAEASGARFMECAFTTVTFSGGSVRCRFNEVWLRAVRVVGAELIEADWLDTTVLSSAFSGIEAYSSQFRRVVFEDCKFDSVNFRAAQFSDVVFEGCLLDEVDWSGAHLSGVSFPRSTLRGVRMPGVTMERVDFRGAAQLHLADGYGSLRGATVDGDQLAGIAPMLAAELGITVDYG
ncbi:pentapeptide repeat-containing protein [Phytoactinopolyspora alkaliphila]|uniref:pentapeptide repeat-containing protein n=1 Tax=Phytoactinopolyspora alkaliphila TaxID=1783498 RepID=UPI001C20295A